MNRLHAELQRLYGLAAEPAVAEAGLPGARGLLGAPGLPRTTSLRGLPDSPGATNLPGLLSVLGATGLPGAPGAPGLSGARDLDHTPDAWHVPGAARGIRVAVLAVLLPAGWPQLAPVWRGVQTDLELPAPAIAISGVDAFQLWFSFASPTSPAAVAHVLQGLVDRYLAGVKPAQRRTFVGAAGLPAPPFAEVGPQRWSAFVTHDLASVFDDTPWLDLAPTDEGQASILHGLASIGPAAFEAAYSSLGGVDATGAAAPATSAAAGSVETGRSSADPARFLADVMDDDAAPLALRIEAARILLTHADRDERGPGGR